MITNSDRWTLARQITVACFAGVLLALPAFSVCFDISGAGHGSTYAFHVFFGPEWVVSTLFPGNYGASLVDLWRWIVLTLGLYGFYGAFLAYARSKRIGVWAFLAILCFHYAAVVWVVSRPANAGGFTDVARVVAQFSIMRSVITVDLLVALHLLALQYARSTAPYRPRMTWPAAAWLAVGLLAGVTLFAWGVSMG